MKEARSKVTVYTSDQRTHFGKEILAIWKDIKSSNFLAYQMAKRDIQSQYRQSLMGIVWSIAPIISTALVWIFLNGTGVVNPSAPPGVPYNLYVLIGTILWSIFIQSIMNPINSINAGKSLLAKLNFPKESLIISGLYKMGFELLLKLAMIIIFMIIYKVPLTGQLLYFPLILIITILFGNTVGIFLAPIGLLYTDVTRLINFGSGFLMYVTPVVYMIPSEGWMRILFLLNPATYFVSDGRACLLGLPFEFNIPIIFLGVLSVLLFLLGLVILRKSMTIIIEKIS